MIEYTGDAYAAVLGNVRRRLRLEWRGAPLPLDRRGARIAGEWLTRPGRRLVPHPLPRAPEPDRTAVARPLRGSGHAQAEQYVRMNCDRISRRQRRRSFCAQSRSSPESWRILRAPMLSNLL